MGQIEAYGAVFNNVDDGDGRWRDRIHPGSFKRTIKNSKERAKARNKDYMLSMLWNHDDKHFMPLGGWTDVSEDSFGLLGKADVLLTTQVGREYYELAKAGMTDQFSIIYDVPEGGASYDSKEGIRDLTEIRLYSMDPVVFAMNDETMLVSVKSASGKTSSPLMDIKTEWTGSKAEKQIFAWAKNDDGEIQSSKAKQCFLWYDPDNSDKQSGYKMPFCYIDGDSPKIVPLGVRACANVLTGGMGGGNFGGDDGAMKAKGQDHDWSHQ